MTTSPCLIALERVGRVALLHDLSPQMIATPAVADELGKRHDDTHVQRAELKQRLMETFPIVKRDGIRRHGEYRTKLLLLDINDRMRRAVDTGEPYQTVVDPPPAGSRVAHPCIGAGGGGAGTGYTPERLVVAVKRKNRPAYPIGSRSQPETWPTSKP